MKFHKSQTEDSIKQGSIKDWKEKLSALWIIFSFMNHSCDYNSTRFSIGNYLFVRAKRLIKRGDEITTPYISAEHNF